MRKHYCTQAVKKFLITIFFITLLNYLLHVNSESSFNLADSYLKSKI